MIAFIVFIVIKVTKNSGKMPKVQKYCSIEETEMALANLIKKSAMGGGNAYGSIPAFPTSPGDQPYLFF
jgi:hypothetical protein